MTALDLSADAGLVAVFLATANMCLGLLIAVRYSPWRFWPHRRINIFAIHNWTAYFVLISVLTHPVILLFSKEARWRVLDLAVPLWSPVQPVENTVGALALYLIAVVVLTSYFRLRLGRRSWKRLHYLVYAAGIGVFIHSILADTELKGHAINPWDGEKIFLESCVLVLLMATTWAWRHRQRKDREERAGKTGRYSHLQSANAND